MTIVDVRPTLDAPDDDPYLWLEEIEGARARPGSTTQNARTLGGVRRAGGRAGRDDARGDLRPARQDPVSSRRRGPYCLQFLERMPRIRAASGGAPRRKASASEQPQWDVLLDLDALAAAEGEDWIWSGASTRPGTHDRAIVQPVARRQRCGGAARVRSWRPRTFVTDGFVLPEAKGSASWLDRRHAAAGQRLGGGDVTTSGYARTVRLWRRGTEPRRGAGALRGAARPACRLGAAIDRTRSRPRRSGSTTRSASST